MTATASTLPSSTPHWSKESIPQIVPWVNTLCSSSATNVASRYGVSTSAGSTFVGRLPSITRCGAMSSAVPIGQRVDREWRGRTVDVERVCGGREHVGGPLRVPDGRLEEQLLALAPARRPRAGRVVVVHACSLPAATHSRATWVTFSGVKPNLVSSILSGADAPNVCMPTTAPPSPT